MELIRSAMDMERTALELGFLPFFRCGIPTFSIEERTDAEYWFSSEEEGPWEWKGPVIREGHCAYGKFFNKKAGYVSLEWLPDLLNVRRTRQYARDEDTAALDEVVLQAIVSERGVTVKELRHLLGLSGRRGKRRPTDMVDMTASDGRISLEPILTRLMMRLQVVIADFVYNTDRHGRPYGWGVARYTVPEVLYGRMEAGCPSEVSYEKIYRHFRSLFPEAPEKTIRNLIG